MAALLGMLAAPGCAFLPGVPAGPIPGAGARLSGAFAASNGAAVAELREPSGQIDRIDDQLERTAFFPLPMPLRVGGRISPTHWLDFGAGIGIADAAFQLRAGPLDAARSLPWGIELEWRTGHRGTLGGMNYRREVYGARIEAYPALPWGKSEDRIFGVLTAGVSSGTHLSRFWRPSIIEPSVEISFGESLDVIREEQRLELAIGMHWLSLPAFATAVVMPWVALDHGRPKCPSCEPFSLVGIENNWGLAIALSGGIAILP